MLIHNSNKWECYLICKRGLCRYTYVKDFKMRQWSWIIWVVWKSKDKSYYKSEMKGDLTHTHRRKRRLTGAETSVKGPQRRTTNHRWKMPGTQSSLEPGGSMALHILISDFWTPELWENNFSVICYDSPRNYININLTHLLITSSFTSLILTNKANLHQPCFPPTPFSV